MQNGNIWVLNQGVNIFIFDANGLQLKNGRFNVIILLTNIHFKNKI